MSRIAPRVRFATGQRLPARDLADAVHSEVRAQDLHVVGAHQAWGVALGFAISASGLRQLTVGPGVAYDGWGRTLVVAAPTSLVPADDATIVATWSDCGAIVRLRDTTDVVLGRDIPLATVTAKGSCSLAVRRFARTRAAPRVGAGTYTAGVQLSALDPAAVEIDTSAAGFVETPSYVVSVASIEPAANRWGPLVSISEPRPEGFTAAVRDPSRAAGAGAMAVSVTLSWIGVEPRGGCPLLDRVFGYFTPEEALP